MLKEVSKLFSGKVKAAVLIFIGTLSWSLTMVKSGWFYPSLGTNGSGLGFWGANGHDGIWHIALIESLSRGSLQMPVFAGARLQNYHIGFDLLVTLLHKITFIPVVNLYFQILPPILALLIGIFTYWFVWNWKKSEKASLWSTFFVYFGGSLGYLLGKGESAFWSQQAISTLINPPFALSLVLILLGMIFLAKYKKILDIRYLILSSIFFGLLVEVKIYAGVLAMGGLLVATVFERVSSHEYRVTKTFLISLVISLILFFSLEKTSSSLLVWQPFWFLETMMGLTDRVGWLKFYSAMTTYKSGHVWLKLIPAYLVAFGIFWIGNMGTRIFSKFAFWKWARNIKNITWVEVFIIAIIIAGGIIPMFFLQKGTPWNTIQFFYYSLFFSSILAGVAMGEFVEKSKLNTTLLYNIEVIVVLLTIPTTILTLKDVYIPARPPAMIPNNELSALDFLSKQSDGVVLTYPFDSVASANAESNPPRPLYLYTSTAYVSAFSKHPTFLEDEVNLDITGYNWPERRKEVESWYKEKNQTVAREFLKNNNIKYVYWLHGQRALLGETQLGLKNIFENKTVIIYQVEQPQN